MKFLAFLGTGEYKTCAYELEGRTAEPTRYVQAALLELLDPEEPVDIIVFLTREARDANWITKDPDKPGLEKVLETRREGRNWEVHPVDIPSSQTEEGIWQVFSKVLDVLKEGDEVIFDITHSFRYQPMLALLVLHFARVVKGIRIRGIYYGHETREKDPATGFDKARIQDITAFADLQEWIDHVRIFLSTGRAQPLRDWIGEKEADWLFDPRVAEIYRAIQGFVGALGDLTASLETCRVPHIPSQAANVAVCLEPVREGELPAKFRPLASLLSRVEEKVRPISAEDPVESGIAAVQWCKRHGLTQQAYTLLMELVVTAVCLKLGYPYEPTNRYDEFRSKVTGALKRKAKGDTYTKKTPLEICHLIDQLAQEHPSLLMLYRELKKDRDDINHAGIRTVPRQPREFTQRLEETYQELIEELRRFWKESRTRETV